MPTVSRVSFTWTVDRDGSRHWLSARFAYDSGEGVLRLELTPWIPSRADIGILQVWSVSPFRVDAIIRFLGAMMADVNRRA